MLDLIFATGLLEILEQTETVLWPDPFTLKAKISMQLPPCSSSKLICACLWRVMEPCGFQAALWDPNPVSDAFNDWNSCLSKAIETIALSTLSTPVLSQHPVYSGAACKSELRQLEQMWWHTHVMTKLQNHQF